MYHAFGSFVGDNCFPFSPRFKAVSISDSIILPQDGITVSFFAEKIALASSLPILLAKAAAFGDSLVKEKRSRSVI